MGCAEGLTCDLDAAGVRVCRPRAPDEQRTLGEPCEQDAQCLSGTCGFVPPRACEAPDQGHCARDTQCGSGECLDGYCKAVTYCD